MNLPITDFNEKTFVAFLDISGFKELMKNEKKAWNALDKFYKYGYEIINKINEENKNNTLKIEGFFISDAGILFIRNCQNDKKLCLKILLEAIKEINKKMLMHDFMLTTSISYGDFKYQKRIEFRSIEKNPIYGNAYVSAFLDNENGLPKIQPGECRILIKNLPDELIKFIKKNQEEDNVLNLIQKKDKDKKHFYFYWMINSPSQVENFEKEYNDTYNLKYAGMLKTLKNYSE